jgi:hypothetical protein
VVLAWRGHVLALRVDAGGVRAPVHARERHWLRHIRFDHTAAAWRFAATPEME